MIFDNVCNHSVAERRRVLNPKGICVLAGMGGTGVSQGQALRRIVGGFTASGFSSFGDQKFVRYMTKLDKQDLAMLGDLLQTGKVRPVIERTCKLSDAPEAFRLLDQGHARGKTVVTIE
jgi:NADPH:quinone reductase-like Zn-dependent oxidoreductase